MREEKSGVFDRIEEKYAKMSRSQKKIAGFIVDHYEEAVFMTAAQIASNLQVSESTVVRFASGIGYCGYPEFQRALEECVKGKMGRTHRMDARYRNSSQEDILTTVMNADIRKLKETLAEVDSAAFGVAVDTILKAKTVYLMGLRSCGPLAGFLAFYLNMIRGNVVLLSSNSLSETFEQMLRISKRDCFIGISFPRYSMRTLKAMEFANDRNAKVIAITDSVNSPMNLYSSCNLFARSDMVSIADSLVAPLSLINALVVALCMKIPQDVKKNLDMLEETWNNYQVGMNDEIDQIGDASMLDEG